MVSHSSSASLSSFSFSHPSHTSSSSRSSPSSSPDSAPSSPQDRSCFACSTSLTGSLVPFLWEEKPGVLKKEMQISEVDEDNLGEGSPSPAQHDAARMHTHRGDANLHSSKRLSKTFPTSRSKACNEGLPRLRPPPRLSQPEHVYVQADDALNLQRLHEQQHHHCRGSTGKVLSSLPFHKRRHHRTPSVEDDPFWMAMVACTNDAGKGSRMRFKDHRGKVFGEVNRGDSWLAKKVQGHSVHFDQCMPRHVCAVSEGDDHGRRKELASSDVNTTKHEAARSTADMDVHDIKSMSTLTHAHTQHHQEDVDASSTRLASKAFKALNIARTELHGRCKALLQQQSPPVEISCGTRLSKKQSAASKRKLPDLFGCKSDGQLILTPRV